jgi:hypothetical protein
MPQVREQSLCSAPKSRENVIELLTEVKPTARFFHGDSSGCVHFMMAKAPLLGTMLAAHQDTAKPANAMRMPTA